MHNAEMIGALALLVAGAQYTAAAGTSNWDDIGVPGSCFDRSATPTPDYCYFWSEQTPIDIDDVAYGLVGGVNPVNCALDGVEHVSFSPIYMDEVRVTPDGSALFQVDVDIDGTVYPLQEGTTVPFKPVAGVKQAGALVECHNPLCPTLGGVPTTAQYDETGSALAEVHPDLTISYTVDMLNTEGESFKIGGGPARTGAARLLVGFTNTGAADITMTVRVRNLPFASQPFLYGSSENPSFDAPAAADALTVDDRWFATTAGFTTEDATILFVTGDSCGGDVPAEQTFAEASSCQAGSLREQYSEWDITLAPSESRSVSVVAEFFSNVGDQAEVHMRERVAELEAMTCSADKRWFADLDATAYSEIVNFDASAFAEGDVHLTGFRGQQYQVNGIDGAWHAMFVDEAIAVNARLSYPRTNSDWVGSIMTEVAVVAPGGWTFLLNVTDDKKAGVISPRAEQDGDAYRFGECGHVKWVDESMVEVTVAGYVVTLNRREYNGQSGTRERFIDIAVALSEVSPAVSGFLGDSYAIVGDDKVAPLRSSNDVDYVVSGPYGVDSTFNSFKSDARENHWAEVRAARTGKGAQGAACEQIARLYSSLKARASSNDLAAFESL